MRIIVIGAGAAGMVAAAEASLRGASVVLLEKNGKTGVKILMSGGTRCNITQQTDSRGITAAFAQAGRFLQPSVGAFPPKAVIAMFSDLGVPTKTESTGKVFPQSDRAVQVRDALHRQAIEAGVDLRLRQAVTALRFGGDSGWVVETAAGPLTADRVIVTSGGKSWPGCGTTGDAYDWLRSLGHTIRTPRPALVPLVGGTDWSRALSGLTLENCVATVKPSQTTGPGGPTAGGGKKPRRGKQRPLVERRSSLLFTHFGLSGPVAMDVSGTMTAAASMKDVRLILDLLPEVASSDVQALLSDRSRDGGRKVATLLGRWLPKRLADALIDSNDCDTTLAQLSRGSAHRLTESIKRLEIPVTGTRGFAKAEVTAGGVALGEVNPKTMESRLVDGLFLAGEVLDVDGWIGGYNFQAAFSTGRAAGIAAATADP